jgi:hypothetical protein
MRFLRGNSDVPNGLAVEMYARGLSVRDIEDALRDATGQPLLSRNAVSELSETLWEDYEAFCERDLSSFAVEYLFIDAVNEGLRQRDCSQALGCAWAICQDGRKVMLHLELGGRESYDTCLSFIRDMVRRGLRTPLLVTSDGAPGLSALSIGTSQGDPHHKPAGARFPGKSSTHEGDPAFLQRPGVSETGLLGTVADQLALAPGDDDRSGATAAAAPGTRLATV